MRQVSQSFKHTPVLINHRFEKNIPGLWKARDFFISIVNRFNLKISNA